MGSLKGKFVGKKQEQGFALIYTLWTLIFLSALGVVVFRSSQLEMRISHFEREKIKLKWVAKGGVEKAIAILLNDETNYDSLLDTWSDNDESLKDFEVGDSLLNVDIYDESGKLNINTASEKELLSLPNMTDDIVASILDWRDSNEEARASGVEGAYYNNLEPSYPIRNGPFRSLRELLLVKGITNELFFGEDGNLNHQLDANENDGEFFYPNDNKDDLLDQGLAAWLTCYSYQKNVDAYGKEKLVLKNTSENELSKKLKIPSKYSKWIYDKHKNAKSLGDLISTRSPEKPEQAGNGKSEAIDLETYKKIFNSITISNESKLYGRVNINTANREVLVAICEGDETLANNLYDFRVSNVLPILNLTEMIDFQAIGIEGFKKVVDKLCVSSHVFQTQSLAVSQTSNANYQVEAYLHREHNDVHIIYLHQGSVR